ncbi:hypothetical protein ACTA71_005406 [Dictyostelium dimigraforme]
MSTTTTIEEILFWKVEYDYDYPNQYNVGNRCKFGNTHSLKTMVNNDLLQLIKDKIKHGDHIQFNYFSILALFSKLSKSSYLIINQQQPPSTNVNNCKYLI